MVMATLLSMILNPIIMLAYISVATYSAAQVASSPLTLILLTAASVGAGLLLVATLSYLNLSASSSRLSGVLGRHTFTFTQEGLHEETEANSSLLKWSSLDRPTLIMSYGLVRASGSHWYGFPRRCFSSNDEQINFIRNIRMRIAA